MQAHHQERMETAALRPEALRSAVEVGTAGLLGGVAGGAVGLWSAARLVGTVEVVPWNLFGGAIAMLGPLLAVAVGAVLGFVIGVLAGVTVLLAVRDRSDFGTTLIFVVALECVVVPVTMWLVVTAGNRWDAAGEAAVWVGAVVVGCVTPASARLLALRRVGPRVQEGLRY